MSFLADIGDAGLDHAADSVINDFIPDRNGLIGGIAETGIDQVVNNDINREFGGGLGSEGGYGNSGGGGFF